MPDKKGNLYLFEAIELRREFDLHIKLIEDLIEDNQTERGRLFSRNSEEERIPSADFDQKKFEEMLKKIQTKRVKLNQAIQIANFKYHIDFNSEKITIAEALEIRKGLLADLEALKQRVVNSAYKRIIHKEERDIIHEPTHSFQESYKDFQEILRKSRDLMKQIHIINHESTVDFKDE